MRPVALSPGAAARLAVERKLDVDSMKGARTVGL